MSERPIRESSVACASELEVAQRIAMGLDPSWQEHIRKTAAKEIRQVQRARRKLRADVRPGESYESAIARAFDEDSAGRKGNLDFSLLIARERVNRHERRGNLTQKPLVEKHTAECTAIREKIMRRGFAVSEQVMAGMGINELELVRLIDRGQFVVVSDHDELVFPEFQFSSPEARHLVGAMGGSRLKYQTSAPNALQMERFNPYPSWQRTLWWFGMYDNDFMKDEPEGFAPVDMIEDGRIQELADRVELPIR